MRELETKKFRISINMLIHAIKENRRKHEQNYADAAVGYRQAVAAALAERLDDVANTTSDEPPSSEEMSSWTRFADLGRVPTSHVGDYDRALMILSSVEATCLELTGQDIAAYMHDEWDWAKDFKQTVAHYSGRVRA